MRLIAISVQLAMVDAADGDRVLIADLAAKRARLEKRMWCASAGGRLQTTQGCVATNLWCSLLRKRLVLAAMRRRWTMVVSGARLRVEI